jgi:sporulation protein YlmC with PRC-barrel domain
MKCKTCEYLKKNLDKLNLNTGTSTTSTPNIASSNEYDNYTMNSIKSIMIHDEPGHEFHWDKTIEYNYTIFTNDVELGDLRNLEIEGSLLPIQNNTNINEIKNTMNSLKTIVPLKFTYKSISELLTQYSTNNVMDLFYRTPENKNERLIIFLINNINTINPENTTAAWAGSYYQMAASFIIAVEPTLLFNSAGTLTNFGIQSLHHEIGHALGLKHPHDVSEFQNASNILNNSLDQIPYTTMTYESGRAFTNYLGMMLRGTAEDMALKWGIIDIMTLQYIYGIPTSELETDDVYKLANNHNYMWFYIHDTKGVNTLDGSEVKDKYLVIDLRKPELSESNTGVNPTGSNIAYYSESSFLNKFIMEKNYVSLAVEFQEAQSFNLPEPFKLAAYTTGYIMSDKSNIQNAIGGEDDDIIIANELDNTLRGGGGNDNFIIDYKKNYTDSKFHQDYIYGDKGNNKVTILNLKSDFDENKVKECLIKKSDNIVELNLSDKIKINMENINTIEFSNTDETNTESEANTNSNTNSNAVVFKTIDLTILKNELPSQTQNSVSGTGVGGIGDPYIISLNGDVWKMSNFNGFSRMFQGTIDNKNLIINVETSFCSKSELKKIHEYTIQKLNELGINTDEILKTHSMPNKNESFMRKLWIQYDGKETFVDMERLILTNLRDFKVSQTKQFVKFPKYDCHESTSICINLKPESGLYLIVSKFDNPQIKTGFQLFCDKEFENADGPLCKPFYKKDFELSSLTNATKILFNKNREPVAYLIEKYWSSNGSINRNVLKMY